MGAVAGQRTGTGTRLPERPGEADCGYYFRMAGCGFEERYDIDGIAAATDEGVQ
jgi:hypothetical protein